MPVGRQPPHRGPNPEGDPGDSVLATSTFAGNNGTAVLALSPGLSIGAPTSLLVTYSFSLTVAPTGNQGSDVVTSNPAGINCGPPASTSSQEPFFRTT